MHTLPPNNPYRRHSRCNSLRNMGLYNNHRIGWRYSSWRTDIPCNYRGNQESRKLKPAAPPAQTPWRTAALWLPST